MIARRHASLALVLPTIIVLASCASSVPTGGTSPAATVDRAAATAPFVPAVVSELVAAVSQQNAVAFEAPASVVDGGVSQSSDSDGLVISLASANKPVKGDSFAKRLKKKAKSAYDAQDAYLGDLQEALAGDDLQVESVSVAVDSYAIDKKSGALTTKLHISRDLSSGVTWEEVIPYVTTIDSSTGEVSSLVVQDDSWRNAASSGSTQDVQDEPAVIPNDGSQLGEVPDESSAEQAGSDGTLQVESGLFTEDEATASTVALNSTQRAKIVTYAKKWWNKRNPAYTSVNVDCTNFVSQAMYAGGWTEVTGLYNSDTAWWHNGPDWPIPKSYAWASATSFYNFARTHSARVTRYSSVYDLRTGDLLQYDIGATGKDHSMVVTSTATGGPYLTYHTTDTLNKPFSTIAVGLQSQTPVWYALKV